jgi:hypothetical protein
MDYLVEDLLKIHTPHHSQIQWLIMRYFSRLSYETRIDDLQGEGFCLSLIRTFRKKNPLSWVFLAYISG